MTGHLAKAASIAVDCLCGGMLLLGYYCPCHSRGRSIFSPTYPFRGSLRRGRKWASGRARCCRKRSTPMARCVSALDPWRPGARVCQRAHVLGVRDGSEWARSTLTCHDGTLDDTPRQLLARQPTEDVQTRLARNPSRAARSSAARRGKSYLTRRHDGFDRTFDFVTGLGIWVRLAIETPNTLAACTRISASNGDCFGCTVAGCVRHR